MSTPRPPTPPPDRRPKSTDSILTPMTDDSNAELTAVIDDLLNQLSTKFSTVSSELLAKMDDMSRRIDSLEATIQGGDGPKGTGSGK